MSEAPAPIITSEAMERWNRLPPESPLQISLRKIDLDNLFLSIRESIIAQSKIGATLIALSSANAADAEKNMGEARQHIENAILNIDRLILHAMTTAEPTQNG